MSHSRVYLAAVCLAGVPWCLEARGGELTVAEFNKLHKDLAAAREEWQKLPWQLSLMKACALAAREKKPVYMLCRSGHPLGCV